ncbi:hypothetical protein KJ632_02450 [Patescibacteria group bacterium]|nr:hypothetical protein [Patescibacteria group bacterium]
MKKTCPLTNQAFEITDSDLEFYKTMGVPEPTLSPNARHQRRTAFRNERSLYQRTCSATGERIISTYPQNAPFPVYSQKYWWGDSWDARDYGQEFDFTRPFFEQFKELMAKVPRFSCTVNKSENCEFNNFCESSRNCYLSQRLGNSEDVYYTYLSIESKDLFDCYNVSRSSLCYEVIDGENCYNLKYSQNVTNCSDSAFLFNCRDCRNCLMCVNMRNAEYCIRNQKVSREEFEEAVREVDYAKMREEFMKAKSRIVVPEIWGTKLENVSGNYLSECKNVFESFDCRFCEDIKYAWGHIYGENSMDTDFSYHVKNSYEFVAGSKDDNIRFCFSSFESHDLNYCMDSMNSSHNLFGCISMKHGEYCILNKQYKREEYEAMLPRIIEHMTKTGEWGEFFPIELSPFGYNETVAHEYFPLDRSIALERGWGWKDKDDVVPGVSGMILAADLPDVAEVGEEILKTAIKCEVSGRLFKIVPKELEFYKKNGLPLPRLHPDERYKRRVEQRAPRVLFERKCAKCGKDVRTSYAEGRLEAVYCEACYLKEVY